MMLSRLELITKLHDACNSQTPACTPCFPRAQAFKAAGMLARDAQSSLALMLHPLAPLLEPARQGELQLDLTLCRRVRPQLWAVQQALQCCCEALTGVVSDRERVEDALPPLQQLEARFV